MQQQKYPTWLTDAFKLCYDTRKAQKAYYQMPKDKHRLARAKALEHQQDFLLQKMIDKGVFVPDAEIVTNQQIKLL